MGFYGAGQKPCLLHCGYGSKRLWFHHFLSLLLSWYLFLYKLILGGFWSVSASILVVIICRNLGSHWYGGEVLGGEALCSCAHISTFNISEPQHSDPQKGSTLGSSPWPPLLIFLFTWGKEARGGCHIWLTVLPSMQKRTLKITVFLLEYSL